jgi:putative transport protein
MSNLSFAILILSAIIAFGVALGSLRYRKIGLGSAGVLFVGILFGQFGVQIEPSILEFARDFGLLLFVYAIGLQVGPSFFSSLRSTGLKLNLLAVIVICLGTLAAFGIHYLLQIKPAATAGLLAGATTNTPSLAAAQAALETSGGNFDVDEVGMAYAVVYPFAIAGIILAILVTRSFLASAPAESATDRPDQPAAIDLELTNQNLDGRELSTIGPLADEQVVASRILRNGAVFVPKNDTALALHDRVRFVGPRRYLNELEMLVGPPSPIAVSPGLPDLSAKRLMVTSSRVAGRTLAELSLETKYSVAITRVIRGELEFTGRDDLCLHLGDLIVVVGTPESLDAATGLVGNEPKALDRPPLIALFFGILCGVLLGSLPIALPGLPASVRFGLAGGPLVAALLFSQLGRLGPLNWYLSPGANQVLREFGMALFLASVGLKAGHGFLATVLSTTGAWWVGLGFSLTLIPLLVASFIGARFLKLDRATLSGVLAGSMTDPPALAFANDLEQSQRPLLAYATVYPLTMVLRIFLAQILVLVITR